MTPDSIANRLANIQERITAAAQRANRSPDAITLVAVTKTHPLSVIHAAYDAGLRHFGENRVEEATEKFDELEDDLPDAIWHMIGHIQSRKTSDVAQSRFDWVHSTDRFKIARRLARQRNGDPLSILLQVNISGEESKYGYDLAGWPEKGEGYKTLTTDIEKIADLDGVRIRGLMTLAPFTDDPEDARPTFRRLTQLRDHLADSYPYQSFSILSMGMSGDYEVAIEEGATHIRLGTALFGARHT